MTRYEKIEHFLRMYPRHIWCEGDQCFCIGCINGTSIHDWWKEFPNDPLISREEFYFVKDEIRLTENRRIKEENGII